MSDPWWLGICSGTDTPAEMTPKRVKRFHATNPVTHDPLWESRIGPLAKCTDLFERGRCCSCEPQRRRPMTPGGPAGQRCKRQRRRQPAGVGCRRIGASSADRPRGERTCKTDRPPRLPDHVAAVRSFHPFRPCCSTKLPSSCAAIHASRLTLDSIGLLHHGRDGTCKARPWKRGVGSSWGTCHLGRN